MTSVMELSAFCRMLNCLLLLSIATLSFVSCSSHDERKVDPEERQEELKIKKNKPQF